MGIFNKQNNESAASLGSITWKRFRKNKLAMTGLAVVVLAVVVSVLGYSITPDQTPYANDQKPELLIREPGFKVQMLLVHRKSEIEHRNFFSKMFFGQVSPYISYPISSYRFSADSIFAKEFSDTPETATESLRFSVAEVACNVKPGTRTSYNPTNNTIQYDDEVLSSKVTRSVDELKKAILEQHIVTKQYILGTDLLGRDLLSRLLIGTRISLTVGLIAVIISIFIGIVLGALAGYFRGSVDACIMWFTNVVWSIPTILLVIAITLALGKGIGQVFVAVGLTMWVGVARQVRGQIFSIREKEFVEAGRALGYSNGRIIFRHILPNVMGPVIISAAENFVAAILTEAGLSFLGLGTQPPMPSWGEMTSAHRGFILMDKAYLAFIPGLAIVVLVLAFMLVSNGLRDAMDSRSVDEKPIV